MFSLEINHLVRQEQYKDILRDIEQQRLLQIAGLQPRARLSPYRKVVSWLGGQMVKWGSKLQSYEAASSAQSMGVETH